MNLAFNEIIETTHGVRVNLSPKYKWKIKNEEYKPGQWFLTWQEFNDLKAFKVEKPFIYEYVNKTNGEKWTLERVNKLLDFSEVFENVHSVSEKELQAAIRDKNVYANLVPRYTKELYKEIQINWKTKGYLIDTDSDFIESSLNTKHNTSTGFFVLNKSDILLDELEALGAKYNFTFKSTTNLKYIKIIPENKENFYISELSDSINYQKLFNTVKEAQNAEIEWRKIIRQKIGIKFNQKHVQSVLNMKNLHNQLMQIESGIKRLSVYKSDKIDKRVVINRISDLIKSVESIDTESD